MERRFQLTLQLTVMTADPQKPTVDELTAMISKELLGTTSQVMNNPPKRIQGAGWAVTHLFGAMEER